VGLPSELVIRPWRVVGSVALLLLVAGAGIACSSSAPATTRGPATTSSIAAGLLVSAAVGTWTCSVAGSDKAFTAKVSGDGTFTLAPPGSPMASGRATLDGTGLHIGMETGVLSGLAIDVLNASLDTSHWSGVTSATLRSSFLGHPVPGEQTLHVALTGLNEVSFNVEPTRTGVQGDTWICKRG
jgi:hypothetical protein